MMHIGGFFICILFWGCWGQQLSVHRSVVSVKYLNSRQKSGVSPLPLVSPLATASITYSMCRCSLILILTWDVPAMSTPASRKLLKSCPNLLVALARSWVVPLDAWTTSLADWLRPAATSLSWAWTSWKLLPLDGNYRGRRRTMKALHQGSPIFTFPMLKKMLCKT